MVRWLRKAPGSLVILSCLLMAEAVARGEPPGRQPVLTVQVVHPDRQLERLLSLFEGARAPHPAAALAGWRRATGQGVDALGGKTTQALIALLNPDMVRELRTLNGAVLQLGYDRAAGDGDEPAWWSATLPADDGTVAALATALALTDGAAELPLTDGAQVDRLGPPGAPLLATTPTGAVAVASDRDALIGALSQRGEPETAGELTSEGGWRVRLDVGNLAGNPDEPESLTRRRVADGLRALGCRAVEATACLDDAGLALVVTGRFGDSQPPRGGVVDPVWLDGVPADRIAAVVAIAMDDAGSTWEAACAVADAVERADPARVGVSPLRARLNTLALLAGVRPDADLWPHLRGMMAGLTIDARGEPDGVLITLHATDNAAAHRIALRVVRPLVARLGEPLEAGIAEQTGRVFGRPLALRVREGAVRIGWGAGGVSALDPGERHNASDLSDLLRAAWPDGERPQRAGAFWPGRLAFGKLAPPGSPLAAALAGAPPVVWWGVNDGGQTRDRLRWDGLRGVVRRFLEHLPMVPGGDG